MKKILNKAWKNVIIIKYRKGGVGMKKWIISELDKKKINELASGFGLPVFTAMLLCIRGMTDEKAISDFMNFDGSLEHPMKMKDMDKAVSRIRDAYYSNERICVYGDYDCDGVTATALLFSYLDSISANVCYYIPDRNTEGYGMNINAIDKLHKDEVKLIITVDNGIAAFKEIDYAKTLGIDVIVTDHHKTQDKLPNAVAVIDPHRMDETASFHDYCGAGIALKLAIALEANPVSIIENYSELAAIGTIADLVPLSGENRDIVKAGLLRLENTERQGISELLKLAQIDKISAGNIAFRLAPRINAAGRLGNVHDALELFLTEDEDKAQEYAEKLSGLNVKRQSIENEIYNDICSRLDADPMLTADRIIIISSEDWNPGVIGIVSSKITERYGKPSIIISEGPDICKASGRSVSGFSLVDAVFSCADMLEKYGGHPMAVGLSIRRSNINKFRKAMNEYADKLEFMPLPSVNLDCTLRPAQISVDMVHQLHAFEPFGYGNPKPVFAIVNMRLDKITPLSEGKHIKLSVSRDEARLNLVKFSTSPDEFPYPEGSLIDLSISLDINIYRGKEYLSFLVKEIRPSGFDSEAAMLEVQIYDDYRRGKLSPKLKELYPERSDFAAVYRFVRSHPQSVYSIDMLISSIGSNTLGAFRLLMILDIFSELRLIEYTRQCDFLKISVAGAGSKVQLEGSGIYRKLKEDIENVRNTEVLSGLS